jgi:hypothetical protein
VAVTWCFAGVSLEFGKQTSSIEESSSYGSNINLVCFNAPTAHEYRKFVENRLQNFIDDVMICFII